MVSAGFGFRTGLADLVSFIPSFTVRAAGPEAGDVAMTRGRRFAVAAAMVTAVIATTGTARAETFYASQKVEFCVDSAGGRPAPRTRTISWPCHGKANQQFDSS